MTALAADPDCLPGFLPAGTRSSVLATPFPTRLAAAGLAPAGSGRWELRHGAARLVVVADGDGG